jgi:streptogramin lyase
MRKTRYTASAVLAGAALGLSMMLVPSVANAAYLSGSVKNAAGQAIAGATVSARMPNSNVVTSVFTDEQGMYYFPQLPDGEYKVYVNALTYQYGEQMTSGKADFSLAELTDWDARLRQLPPELLLAGLPGSTARPDSTDEDKYIYNVFLKNCTGCHTASWVLQNKFDERGWNAIITAMARINIFAVPSENVSNQIEFYRDRLVSYLLRVRGPGESELKIDIPAGYFPTGEVARTLWREYEMEYEPKLAANLPSNYMEILHNGGDWTKGAPMRAAAGISPHDAVEDDMGNFWVTSNHATTVGSIARIDKNTGEHTWIGVEAPGGKMANVHGITRDADGMVWYAAGRSPLPGSGAPNTMRNAFVRVNPATLEQTIFEPPAHFQPLGTSTGDVGPDGAVWWSAANGVIRLDPKTGEFAEFFTEEANRANSSSYGTTVDANGNGWWARHGAGNIVSRSDSPIGGPNGLGKSHDVRMPTNEEVLALVPAADRQWFTDNPQRFEPWSRGVRRLGADRGPGAQFVMVGNSYENSISKINMNTDEVEIVPTPHGVMPYHGRFDHTGSGNFYANALSADVVLRTNANTLEQTIFPIPDRGAEQRHLETYVAPDGRIDIMVTGWASRSMYVMTVRSEDEIARLRAM